MRSLSSNTKSTLHNITLWMVKDIAPELLVPFTQSEINDITEEERDHPYDNFFTSSHSSLHSPSSGPAPTGRLWRIFIVPSLLRTPATNEPVRLQERLKRRFLTRRAHSSSPSVAPANNESTKPMPDGKVRTGKEHNKDVDLPDCSANMMSGGAEEMKGKQREELADAETLPPDDASPAAEVDTDENRTFWTFLRARGKNATTCPAQITHGHSPKAVEVYANRVSQGYVAWKRKRKAKSSSLMIGAATTAAQASGSSQAGPSSHGHPAHGHISSLGQAGVSSQVSGGPNTMDDLSDSDSIQGSWNKFLDKICFPCGHYEDD